MANPMELVDGSARAWIGGAEKDLILTLFVVVVVVDNGDDYNSDRGDQLSGLVRGMASEGIIAPRRSPSPFGDECPLLLLLYLCQAISVLSALENTNIPAIAVQDYGLQMGLVGPRRQKADSEVASLSSPDRKVGRDGRRLERESAQ